VLDFRLIVDLVTVLASASVGGLLAAKLKLPVILGYIVGGIVVGPTGLTLIKEVIQVETLAQLGAGFLLFALGVEFSFSELQKVKRIAIGGGGAQIALTIGLTALISVTIGWVSTPTQGIFLGSILSLSSTAVVLRTLMERNELETVYGQVSLGILIVQDIALGLMLAVLPALDSAETAGMAVFRAVAVTALFAGAAIVVGKWLIPPLLRWVAQTESKELFLLTVIVICFSIALVTESLGLSIEMGAFVAGLMISEVEYADQTLTYVEPLRDVFATLFFASIGMLIDPLFLWQNIEIILGLVAITIVGKALIVVPLAVLCRYSLKVAIITGISLAQIGEFSFVLATEGQKLGLVSRSVYLLTLGTTALTLMLTPFLVSFAPTIIEFLSKIAPFSRWLNSAETPQLMSADIPKNHVIVCGYGQVGQNIVSLLLSRNYPLVVIEQSEARVQLLREKHIPYIYGNCASPLILSAAHIKSARSLVIVSTDPIASKLCLQTALELVPNLDVIARAHKDSDIDLLYQLGAREVVYPNFEASLELSKQLLLLLGEKPSIVEEEINTVRQTRYVNFRPHIACPLPSTVPESIGVELIPQYLPSEIMSELPQESS
jgi:CPA2 family monovalent cation:H+ antiporter-2